MRRRGRGGSQPPERSFSRKEEAGENPYLAHTRNHKARRFEGEVFYRRRRRDERALMFNDEEEEEYEEGAYAGREHQQPSAQEEERWQRPSRPDSGQPSVDAFISSVASSGESGAGFEQQGLKNLDVPGMEWWDVVFLPKDMRGQVQSWDPETAPWDQLKLNNQKSSLYIEHPVPMPPSRATMESNEPLKVYQTKAEMKRMRRLRRAQLNKEKQDKIALGLLPPPPPKVRLANLTRVLAAEHAADPSAIEARVREEMELRERQHQARNLARKLTPEERAAKVRRRVERDAQNPVVHVAVFRITNMELMQPSLAKKRMVKMLLNAKKLLVNGRVLVVRAPTTVPTMVYVEGGPRSIRKFVRLVLHRIHWKAKTLLEEAASRLQALQNGEEDDDSSESDDDSSVSSSSSGSSASSVSMASGDAKPNAGGVTATCRLVWKGTSTRREYDGFHRQVFDSALDVRQFLQQKNLAYLWDAVANAPDGDDNARIVKEMI